MDPITQEIVTWDMSHLTQQQIMHLHALKNLALKVHLREYVQQMEAK